MDVPVNEKPPPLGLLEAAQVAAKLRRLSADPALRLEQLQQIRGIVTDVWLALPEASVPEAWDGGLLRSTFVIANMLAGTLVPAEHELLLTRVRRALQEDPGDRSACAAIAFPGQLGQEDEDRIFPAASPEGKRRLLPALLAFGVDLGGGGAERECRRLQTVTDQILEWLPTVSKEEAAAFFQELRSTHTLVPSYFLECDTTRLAVQRARLLASLHDWPGMHEPHQPLGPVPSGRRIRLGILARTWDARSETFALLPVFEHLDPARFETILLSLDRTDTPTEAYCTSRVGRALVVPQDLPAMVATLRGLDLDILLFGNNLSAGIGLADAALGLHRVARIQVNFVCSPITSGLPHMDRFLQGEGCEAPEGAAGRYTEELALLPGSGFCFSFAGRDESPGRVVARADLGIQPGEIVFVSGANYFKLLPHVRDAWSRILAAVPNSVLLLYPFGPAWSEDYPQDRLVEFMLQDFDRHGVERDRLVVVGSMKNVQEVRGLLRCGDVYLDAFPYSGATSLQEPLDVGLPMVVVEGRELRFRQGAAILREAGLDILVAKDSEAYVELAVRLGGDHALRGQFAGAVKRAVSAGLPCRNGIEYAKQVGAAFERMVEDWNRGWPAADPASAHPARGTPLSALEGVPSSLTPTIRRSKLFRESERVHHYLDGLQGLEIGGSAHNAFGVSTLNVDFTDDLSTPFKLEERRLCGEAMTVDIIGSGDAIPLPDKAVDFVLSSHVIEHFWDPIKALKEWRRLAKRFIVIICPQRDALESDIPLPLTGLYELQQRHEGRIPPPEVDTHDHYSRWTSGMFCQLCESLGFEIVEVADPDDKVGNGFLVVLRP